LRVLEVGLVPYARGLALQHALHARVAAGTCDDTLLLLEHTPVFTLGRNTGDRHVLLSREALAKAGVDVCQTERGGDVTYHGPGQVVAYPIVRLRPERGECDVKRYVGHLEEAMLATAADFGVCAERHPERPGIWVGKHKLGAVGVRIAQWTTLHGVALNVTTDLSPYQWIVPCGLVGFGVTSFARVLAAPPAVAAVAGRLAVHLAVALGRTLVPAASPDDFDDDFDERGATHA
jgi:lipoyl(octanoyl) transferase